MKKSTKTKKQIVIKKEFLSIQPFSNELTIEKFLPKLRTPRNEKLREQIRLALYTIQTGESFFIPKERLHVGTIRKIVLPELKKREFKDKEIRIVLNKKHELSGCRIARYI